MSQLIEHVAAELGPEFEVSAGPSEGDALHFIVARGELIKYVSLSLLNDLSATELAAQIKLCFP